MIFFFDKDKNILKLIFWKIGSSTLFCSNTFFLLLHSIVCYYPLHAKVNVLISFMILLLIAPYLLNLSTVQCYFTILLLIAPYLLNLSTVQCYFTNNNLRINKTDLPRDFWINRQKKYLCSLH